MTLTSPTPVKARPHPLSVTNAERQQMRRSSPEKGGASPNKKMDPLTPGKHGQSDSLYITPLSWPRTRPVRVFSQRGVTHQAESQDRGVSRGRDHEEVSTANMYII